MFAVMLSTAMSAAVTPGTVLDATDAMNARRSDMTYASERTYTHSHTKPHKATHTHTH